ncbi:MAG: glycosyltransferase family 39 protein [Acidobacteriales bacterium]|nr:glycosyltransferase family 39 protein [Terriglobales bacterium]
MSRPAWLCVVLLAIYALLVVQMARQQVVTVDEGGHIIAGVAQWQYGAFDIYGVNPPLIRLLTALPIIASNPKLDDTSFLGLEREWLPIHEQFMRANAEDYQELIFRARLMVLAISLLGGWLIFLWSKELFGPMAGMVAVALWTLCPNVLAFAGVATMDLGAATFGILAMYAFWHYARQPGLLRAGVAGLALGCALLTKFSLLLLYPIWLVLWTAGPLRSHWQQRKLSSLLDPIFGLLASLLVINAGYGFSDCFKRLGEFRFRSAVLAGRPVRAEVLGGQAEYFENRFRDTWLERLRVPVPAEYLLGLDEQRSHFDYGFPAYLRGEWRTPGWWYYYLYAAAIKIPLGTWLLGGLAAWLAWQTSKFRLGWFDEISLWLPPIGFFVLTSSQTGINSHFRYALPALPFLFIGLSRVGRLLENSRIPAPTPSSAAHAPPPGTSIPRRLAIALLVVALGWNAFSVLRVHPHQLSYFNELAGGPENGWQHLVDSNIDWGQDLLFLKKWIDSHTEARPLHLAYFGSMEPRLLGIEYRLPPQGPGKQLRASGPTARTDDLGPKPGWYAVSVNLVCGMPFSGYNENGRRIVLVDGVYRYFRHFQPVAKAGYSIFIYHIALEEANAVRRQLGLPLLENRTRNPAEL